VTLDETRPISDWMQTLYTSVRPTPEQLAQIATTKYRESLAFPTRNVTAWFDKWEEAMAVANKHELFGSHKGMWIKDIYTIWRERFPFVVEKLYSDYSAGSTPDLTYTEVSRLFRTKLEMEGELKCTGKSREEAHSSQRTLKSLHSWVRAFRRIKRLNDEEPLLRQARAQRRGKLRKPSTPNLALRASIPITQCKTVGL